MIWLHLALSSPAHAEDPAPAAPAAAVAAAPAPMAAHDLLAITVYALVRYHPGEPQVTVTKFSELKTGAVVAPLGLYAWGPKALTFVNLQSGRGTDLPGAGPVQRAWALGDHLLYESAAGVHAWDGVKGADTALVPARADGESGVLAVDGPHRLALLADGDEVRLVRFDADLQVLAKLPGGPCVTGAIAPAGDRVALASSARDGETCGLGTTLGTWGVDGARRTTVAADAGLDLDSWTAAGLRLLDRFGGGDFVTPWTWTGEGPPVESELPGPAPRTVPDGVTVRLLQGQPELFAGSTQISDFAGLPLAGVPRETQCDRVRTVEARRIGPHHLLATVGAFDCDKLYFSYFGDPSPAWAVLLDTTGGPSSQVVLATPDRDFEASRVDFSPTGTEALVNGAVVVGPDGRTTRLAMAPTWWGWLPAGAAAK